MSGQYLVTKYTEAVTIFKTQVGTQILTNDLTGKESIWNLMEYERMQTCEHVQAFEESRGGRMQWFKSELCHLL